MHFFSFLKTHFFKGKIVNHKIFSVLVKIDHVNFVKRLGSGTGSKLGQISGSGTKYNEFGSTTQPGNKHFFLLSRMLWVTCRVFIDLKVVIRVVLLQLEL